MLLHGYLCVLQGKRCTYMSTVHAAYMYVIFSPFGNSVVQDNMMQQWKDVVIKLEL